MPTHPRLSPLEDDQIDAEIRDALGPGAGLNIFRTLAHHPKLLKRWLVFGNHVLAKSTLPARERELVILRIGWLCRAEYEWGQHVVIGRAAGLGDDEIRRIAAGPNAGWDARDRALLEACDELHADSRVSDPTWTALSAHYDTKQLLDVLFTIGQYTLVSMVLNSLGVQLEPGLLGFSKVMSGRLDGKIAIVVGAGQTPGDTIGNGRATAILFAREGARVVAVDRTLASAEETVAMIESESGSAVAVEADATREADCQAFIERTLSLHGRVDILHNNVGIGGGDAGPAHVDEAAWDRILAVNLKSVILPCKHVLPVMRRQRGGAIVNVSSIAAVCATPIVAYKVSKAGVNAYTQSLAIGNAKHGIRANAIMPGLMNTPMAVEGISQALGIAKEDLMRARDAQVPLGGKMGTAWDVAYAALFLASDEARFITGVALAVDGGQSARIG